jgi:hypothetical protein
MVRPKPDHLKRILILGDSFTLGTTHPFSETFPGRLERMLQRKGDWQVVAMAVDDWGTAQQLIALEHFGLGYSPDAVVLQIFPFNDFCNNCLPMAFTCSMQDAHRPYFIVRENELYLTNLYPWRSRLRQYLRFFGLLENWLADPWAEARRVTGDNSRFPELRGYFEYNARRAGLRYPDAMQVLLPDSHQQQEIKDCWLVMECLLSEFSALLRKEDIPWLGLVIPFLYTFEPGWDKLRSMSDSPMRPRYGTDRVEEHLRSLGVPTISMRSQILDGEASPEDYFISLEDGHLNDFGHAKIAEWILEILADLRLISGDPEEGL